jgi:hypothetical protein
MKYLYSLLCIGLMMSTAWSQDQAAGIDSIPQFAQKDRIGGSLGFGFLSGNAGNYHQAEPGATLDFTVNYRPFDYHSVGIGIGSRLPYMFNNLIHMPVYLQYKYWMIKKPYVKIGLNGGYGFAFKDEANRVMDARGGLMLNPFVGIILNQSEEWAWTFDIGLLYQKLYYRFGDVDIWGSEENQHWRLYRFVFTTTIEI